MAKPFRSPLVGYNHNLSHLGKVFHVQTEDSGPGSPRLFTHLFYEGTILASRRQEYDSALADSAVRVLMRAQHKSVIQDLMEARLDEKIGTFFRARGQEVQPVQGALPAAPLTATPGKLIVPTSVPTSVSTSADEVDATVHVAAEAGPTAVESQPREETAAADAPAAVPRRIGPRRSKTLPFEMQSRDQNAGPVGLRPAEDRRSPFVRSVTQPVSTIASTDGVVVHRNVVVGAPATSQRPARIRPPVPYVVAGGGHVDRLPQQAPSGATAGSSAAEPIGGLEPAVAASPTPPGTTEKTAAADAPRPSASFGVGRTDDKSLDEVILEYLAEDGDADR